VEEVLPIGGDEWDQVRDLHLERYPDHDRNTLSLRRKFTELHKSTIPTGDPNIPRSVLRAKEIFARIISRADTADHDINDDELGFDDNGGDDDHDNDDSNENGSGNGGGSAVGSTVNNNISVLQQRPTQSRPMVMPRGPPRTSQNQPNPELSSVVSLMTTQLLERVTRNTGNGEREMERVAFERERERQRDRRERERDHREYQREKMERKHENKREQQQQHQTMIMNMMMMGMMGAMMRVQGIDVSGMQAMFQSQNNQSQHAARAASHHLQDDENDDDDDDDDDDNNSGKFKTTGDEEDEEDDSKNDD
jgi:hypothetical protein